MNINKIMQYGLLTLAITCPRHIIATDNTVIESPLGKPSSHYYEMLEEKFPEHFTGFKETPFQLIQQIRNHLSSGKRITDPMNGVKVHLSKLSDQLESWSDFSHIKKDIDKQLETHEEISLATYTYYIWRIAISQGLGIEEESSFFKVAGFSKPYDYIFKIDEEFLKKEPSNIQEFLSMFKKMNSLDASCEGYNRESYTRSYQDKNNTVKNEYIKKNPYAKISFFLPGSDILGYFYLALTYAQGIHPIPIPFDNNRSELHGIPMSRWAKYCHDEAHSEADLGNFSAEQFAYHIINHYRSLLIKEGKYELKTPEEKKIYSVTSMLPHFATFAMKVHEIYRESLVAILEKSLETIEENYTGFEAFSVSAFHHLHERPLDLSRKYGTIQLESLLTADNKEEDVQEEKNIIEKEKATDNRFETSYRTGETQLTDEQIFNLVKDKPRSRFLGQHSLGTTPPDQTEISDYEVLRNKLYIEVKIKMLSGEELIYLQPTNHSLLLNFNHDFSILNTAKITLKNEYGYNLPKIPNPEEYREEKVFEKDAIECLKALNKGFMHLKDIWAKKSIELSHHKLNNFEKSISEQFEARVKEALEQLRPALPAWTGNLEDFIRDAVNPPKL